ncbi:MAG: flagellar basal body P-ring formation chaperone FlgA [Pseudomonadales bacterium]|nr:flagellar basal body P-ring formation chaperone FlgA [Pseudomonadales bacterium]
MFCRLHRRTRQESAGPGPARRAVVGLLTLALAAGSAGEAAREELGRVREAAVAAVRDALPLPRGARLALAAGALDPRLRLARCPAPLVTDVTRAPASGGRISVRVACPEPPRWQLYVPVEARVTAPVAVAVRDLPRGVVLAPADLRLEQRELSRLPWGHAGSAEELAGRILRRPLRSGEPVPPSATAAAPLVRTGERVVIEAGSGPLSVRIDGVALVDGGAGDRVRVRNLNSSRVMDARVTGEGRVHVGPGAR